MDYKVSVIVPVYNAEEYIVRCLDSIINQTYKNLEIILINDGSTDNSPEICDKYAMVDERIIVIHRENSGVSSARNKGIEIATGDFIGFVDSDDFIEPDMYEKLVSIITSDDIDIATCGYSKDYPDGEIVLMENIEEVPECPMPVKDFLGYLFIRDKHRNVPGYICMKLFRASVIKENNILFDENMVMTEDILFLAYVLMLSKKIVYTNKRLYHYFQRETSAYHSYKLRIDSMGTLIAYERIAELFSENNVDENIIDYVKRFLVYHASLLLKMSYENDYLHKVNEIKSVIRKHFDAYERTNSEYPERIAEVKELIEREIYSYMKKILIACSIFAPDNEIAAVKTTKIAKYLLKSGYDVEVITEKNTYSAFDDHLLKGIEKIKPLYVHPTKSYFILKKLYDKIILPHKKKRFDDTTSKKRLRKNKETGLIETVPFETAYPFFGTIDYMMEIIKEKSLVKNAKKYIKEHKNDYDVCFSTYGRYFGHYIGEYIKKINPEVLWIAEFRDPVYNELFNAPPTRRHAEKFSENVYRKCDRITVISNGMKNLIPEKYRDKTTVLTNGFDRDDKIQDTSFEKKDKFRFIYTGRMYGGVRKTQRLFEVIKELSDENRIDISDFEFHYAGTGFKIFESQAKVFGLEKNCVDHGFVSHKKAMELQENSDILIVSTWEYKSQNVGVITGKVFEYMICEKPVIVLVNADFEDVELVSLARRCNIGFAFNEYNLEKDFKDLKEYIVMQYNLFKEGKELFYSPVSEEVEKYNYVNITKQLVNIIESSDK